MSKPYRSSPTRHRLKCLSILSIATLIFLFCLKSTAAASDSATLTAPTAAYNEPVPITVYDETAGHPAEYLVNEYPVPPQRQIYILTPGHQYRFQLDLSAQQDRPAAKSTTIDASFVSSLPDDRIGFINLSITEIAVNGARHCYSGRLAFVADCPDGITLSLAQPTADNAETLNLESGFSFTLNANAGQTENANAHEAFDSLTQRVQFQSGTTSVCISGNPQYVSCSPELDPDLVVRYLWPDDEYTYDYPWPSGEPSPVEAVG